MSLGYCLCPWTQPLHVAQPESNMYTYLIRACCSFWCSVSAVLGLVFQLHISSVGALAYITTLGNITLAYIIRHCHIWSRIIRSSYLQPSKVKWLLPIVMQFSLWKALLLHRHKLTTTWLQGVPYLVPACVLRFKFGSMGTSLCLQMRVSWSYITVSILELQGDIESWSEQCAKRCHIKSIKCSTCAHIHTYIHACMIHYSVDSTPVSSNDCIHTQFLHHPTQFPSYISLFLSLFLSSVQFSWCLVQQPLAKGFP